MSTTKRNSIFKTLVSNVDSTDGLEAEKGALVNHSGTLKMGDGEEFNEVGGGGGPLEYIANVSVSGTSVAITSTIVNTIGSVPSFTYTDPGFVAEISGLPISKANSTFIAQSTQQNVLITGGAFAGGGPYGPGFTFIAATGGVVDQPTYQATFIFRHYP